MTTSVVPFVCVVAALTCAQLAGKTRNFPLDDCSADVMDVLFLFLDIRNKLVYTRQSVVSEIFVQDLQGFPSNKPTPRVMSAQVIDRFTVHEPNVTVSSWRFHASPGSEAYGVDDKDIRRQRYINVTEAVVLKVKFVQRLFFEMGGVRENAIHVAVVFLDGDGLSKEEIINVGRLVQQQATDVKIFAVVVSNTFDTDTLYLNDVVLVNVGLYLFPKHGLTMAICDRCMDGWFTFQHSDIPQSLSCYTVLRSNVSVNWHEANDYCHEEGYRLATIETKSELTFLRTKIALRLLEMRSQSGNWFGSPIYVYVGLRRDSGNPAKIFAWQVSQLLKNRPLMVNNWDRDKPSSGECGVWQFVWNESNTESVISRKGNGFADVWVGMECETRISPFVLCEISVPRGTEVENAMKIKPATNESFNRALAKGDFSTFEDNIVSISSNIANTTFLKSIQKAGLHFPMFNCGVGEGYSKYISFMYVCDSIDHCSNRRDEALCTSETRLANTDRKELPVTCNGAFCSDGLPFHWLNDSAIDCFVCSYGTDKEVHGEREAVKKDLQINKTYSILCTGDMRVQLSQPNTTRTHILGTEVSFNSTSEKLKTANACYNTLDQSIRAPKCVYARDRHGAVLGCRDMSHLENCSHVECPERYFKCPNTYCIPQHYVLDGQADCPSGEDEESDLIGLCTGNFACSGSQVCLHPDLVCDEHVDCPHGDDEADCRLSCVEGFRCVSGTMTVSNYNGSIQLNNLFPLDKRIKYLGLSGLNLSVTGLSTEGWKHNAVFVILSNCSLDNTIIKFFSTAQNVRFLDLSHNHISSIDGSYRNYSPLESVHHLNLSYNTELTAFKYVLMSSLETLDLSHTGLSDLDESSLVGLPKLKHLNVSFTLITSFPRNVFPSVLVLETLDLRGLRMNRFYRNNFNDLTINKHLHTDSFQLCCPQIRGNNIPEYTCHAPDNAISSCFDLVGVDVQRVLLWVVAVLAVLGNLTVIVYRVIWDRSVLRTGYGLFVTNLGISDFIMGVYLFIIAGADYYYRGDYVLFDQSWKESVVCRLAGFLAVLSCETSIFFVLLVTLDRFLAMKFPFGQIKFSKTSKSVVLIVSWIVGFLLAIIPVAFNLQVNSSSASCLALPLTRERLSGWQFSFSTFIGLNMCMCLVIAGGQRAIYRAMSENRITGTAFNTSPRQVGDIMVAKQLSLIALFNFLCWFPIGTMGLLSLIGHEISNNVFAWTLVFVLPINSAANPFLYTIPVLVTKWENFKHGGRKSSQLSV